MFAEGKVGNQHENKEIQFLKSVNINTPNKVNLMKIPEIELLTEERILGHREHCGLFGSVEGALKVNGVGPKIFEKN